VTTVNFVRHGSHDSLGRRLCGRMPGILLNAAGEAEAHRLAERFRHERIAAVYSSPLERTVQTASPIAAALGLQVETDMDINELDLGGWTGAAFGALSHKPDWQWWNAARGQHRPPGGETMIEVQVRVSRWLETVRRRYPEEAVVAVSHGDVIKAALAFTLGLSLDHHARLDVDPGSINTIQSGDWGLKVLRVNEVP
jgi:broad specificity phosphatase PhoE